jgi:hypothetical protein
MADISKCKGIGCPVKKQCYRFTAIEWLAEQFDSIVELYPSQFEKINRAIEQAKELEKEQIFDAYWNGGQDIPLTSERCEQYYNETYNSK